MLTHSEKKLLPAKLTLWSVGLNPESFQRIRHSPLVQILYEQRLFPSVQPAMNAFIDQHGDGL